MSPVTRVAGVELSYHEQGSGPAVLLVHGVAGDAATWDPLVCALAPGARVIAYDRRGYGASEAPPDYRRTTVQEQARDAALLVSALGAEPVLLCGADLGAVICLELALHSSLALTGLVLAEPAVLALAPGGTEALSAQRAQLEQAIRERGPAGAVEVWLSGWSDGRAGDPARLRRARRDTVAFFADYAGLASWSVRRRALRALRMPVRIVEAPTTPPHLVAAGRALAPLIPGAAARGDGDLTVTVLELLAAADRGPSARLTDGGR